MSNAPDSGNNEHAPVNWPVTAVLGGTFVAALTVVPWYGFTQGFNGWSWFFFGLFLRGAFFARVFFVLQDISCRFARIQVASRRVQRFFQPGLCGAFPIPFLADLIALAFKCLDAFLHARVDFLQRRDFQR